MGGDSNYLLTGMILQVSPSEGIVPRKVSSMTGMEYNESKP